MSEAILLRRSVSRSNGLTVKRNSIVTILISVFSAFFVFTAGVLALCNTVFVKDLVRNEIERRFRGGLESSVMISGVSPLGDVSIERMEVRKEGTLCAYAEDITVSGIGSLLSAGGFVVTAERLVVYPEWLIDHGRGAMLSRAGNDEKDDPAAETIEDAISRTNLHGSLSVKRCTLVVRDFYDDFSLRVKFDGTRGEATLEGDRSAIRVYDIDVRTRTARIDAHGMRIEKYSRFLPALNGKAFGEIEAKLDIALRGSRAFSLSNVHVGVKRFAINQSLLDDEPFRIAAFDIAGAFFISRDMIAARGTVKTDGVDIPFGFYKWKRRVMASVSASEVGLNDIARLIAPASGTILNRFNMAGGVSFNVVFSARVGKRIALERFGFRASISETRQLSDRMEFLKKPFYCYHIDQYGDVKRRFIGDGDRYFTSLEGLPKYAAGAILCCEDKGFYRHRGIDFWGIQNAIRLNFSKKNNFLRGGSTITQQVVKNLFLSREKKLVRKLTEFLLTCEIEASLPKERILEIYLNLIELGPDIYGLGKAARIYFNKPASDLTPLESLYLASVLSSPKLYFDIYYRNNRISDFWEKKLRRLLNVMVSLEYITENECVQSDPAGFRFFGSGS